MFTFDTVQAAIMALDVPRLLKDVQLAGGLAWLSAPVNGLDPEEVEEVSCDLADFIRSGALKRELEMELAEGGRIDLTPNPKTDPLTIGEDFTRLDPVPALKRLYQRWSMRKAARLESL